MPCLFARKLKMDTSGVGHVLRVIVTLLSVSLSTSSHLSSQDMRNIDSFIRATMDCRKIPGLVLSVVHRDEIIMERGYGKADVVQSREMTPFTPIPIASNTKSFTATLMAMLVQNNTRNFTWDTTVKSLLGDSFLLYDPILTQQTTLRDLLSHRTGVPDYFIPFMAIWPDNETRESLIWRLRYHKPEADFRSEFHYNNYMYALAGYIAQVLTGGSSWETLITKYIFEPLGMTSSSFAGRKPLWDEMALPYVLHKDEITAVDKILATQANVAGPAGSIVSTGHDMSKWMRFLLRQGATESGNYLVQPNVLMETWKSHMPRPSPMNNRDIWKPTFPVSDVLVSYNMGLFTKIYRGFKRIGHSGSIATYKSQVWFYPDQGFGIFLDCNGPPIPSTTRALGLMVHYISDALLGQPQWLNSSTACTFPVPWRHDDPDNEGNIVMNGPPPLPNDTIANRHSYAGIYSHPGFGNILISVPELDKSESKDSSTHHASRLRLRMGRAFDAFLYYQASSDTFYTNFTGIYWYSNDRIPIKFQQSEDNKRLMNRLYMPMHSPYELVRPACFIRGEDPKKYFKYRHEHYYCSAMSINCNFYILIVVLLSCFIAV